MDLSLTYIAKIKINSCICIFFLQFQHVLVPRVLMMDGVWYTTITTFVFVQKDIQDQNVKVIFNFHFS